MSQFLRHSWFRVFGAALVCVALAGLGMTAGAQQEPGLFGDAAVELSADAAPDLAELRARAVSVDFGKLPAGASADAPARLVLNLFDDATFVALIDKVEIQGLNAVSYTGHVEGFADSPDGNDQNQVSLVVLDGAVAGSVVTPKGSFQIASNGSTHLVRQVDPAAYPEDEVVEPKDDVSSAQLEPGGGAMGDDGSITDLMVLYTSAARAQAGSTAAIQALITLGVTETNLAYSRSGVITRLRLRHMRETAYVEQGAGTDLSNLASGAGVLNVVPGLRNTYGADLVKLVTTNAGCGIAYLGGPAASMAGQQDRGYSVTQRSCISPNYTFGHELGHNQGNNHAPGDPVGTGAYSYSFGFRRCTTTPYFRSVMAYACPSGATGTARSLNFSNPNVNVSGAPTGTATQYNAASMNNVRSAYANWRQATEEIRVTNLWPPADQEDRRPGQTTTLWAYVVNQTPYALTASDRVYMWTDGPGTGVGEGYVGYVALTGLAPGAGRWYGYNWTIPNNVNPGAWVYWARVWNTSTGWRGNWKGPQAFTIYSLAGTISQTWPVNGASNGHTSTLWAYTNNTGTGAFPPNTSVWFWVTGPGINGYVGSVNVAGQASGASAWRGYNWAIPNNKAGGAHTYKAIIWTYSAGGGGWKQLSPFSATRAFTIAYNAYFGEVVQTWPVYRAGTALPPIRGTASRFWDNGRNSGALTHDANTRMWFYLTGPSGFSARYIGSVQTTGQTINTNVWRTVDYAIPAGSPLGTYTYYGIFWRWNGSSWILAGPNPGLGRSFGVAADENTAVPESDLKPAELPPGGAPPPPPPGQ